MAGGGRDGDESASRRARLYCYIKVPRPPLPDGKPPVCGDGGPCGRRASRSGLPFGSHEKEPGFVRRRPGGGSAGCGLSRIRGAGGRLRSRDLPSLAPCSPVLPTVACKAICIFNHPPLPGFGNCGLKQGELEVLSCQFWSPPAGRRPRRSVLMKMGVASNLSPRLFWAALGTKRPYFTG